jgi:quercetin dioxygenase-like cupin family protein
VKSSAIARFACPALLALASLYCQAQGGATDEPKLVNLADVQWTDGTKLFPPGLKISVLRGELNKGGQLTVLMHLPKGYRFPPHWHPQAAQLTVLSGTVHVGVGETLDEQKATALQAGGYAYLPATTHHYQFTRDTAVIALQGSGPLEVNYLNPTDDPRNR